MPYFYVQITDTFGGDANYSWVTRHKVRASSPRGAMIRVNRDSGLRFRRTGDYGDCLRYDSQSGATCAFVSEWDDTLYEEFSRVNEL